MHGCTGLCTIGEPVSVPSRMFQVARGLSYGALIEQMRSKVCDGALHRLWQEHGGLKHASFLWHDGYQQLQCALQANTQQAVCWPLRRMCSWRVSPTAMHLQAMHAAGQRNTAMKARRTGCQPATSIHRTPDLMSAAQYAEINAPPRNPGRRLRRWLEDPKSSMC